MTSQETEMLSAQEAAEHLGHRVSAENVRRALAAGELKGRNFGGSVGWMTTKPALTEWIENGNQKPARLWYAEQLDGFDNVSERHGPFNTELEASTALADIISNGGRGRVR